MTTVSDAFSDYLTAKTPKDWERQEVTRYRERLHDSLNAKFGLIAFFQSGSFGNGTGISGHSDVDYIARLPYDTKPGSSTTALNRVRDHLRDDLWEAASVSMSRPTVSVDFSDVIRQYEIVPAFLDSGQTEDTTVLLIPGPGGGWLESAPKGHLKYVREADQEHSGSVKGLVRLLKGWKYEHAVPVSSFYLEMRAAQYGKANDRIWYLDAAPSVMKSIIDSGMADMNDPLRLVSRIPACSSQVDRVISLSRMRTAHAGLVEARNDWYAGRYWDCGLGLRTVYGTDFPYVTEGPQ